MSAPELRLLIGPVTLTPYGLKFGSGYRWVTEGSNSHPGQCAEDCWHSTPTAALRCWEGRG